MKNPSSAICGGNLGEKVQCLGENKNKHTEILRKRETRDRARERKRESERLPERQREKCLRGAYEQRV